MEIVISNAGEDLERFHLRVQDIPAYVGLVKEYGYLDDEGTSYLYGGAMVEPGPRLYVNVTHEE